MCVVYSFSNSVDKVRGVCDNGYILCSSNSNNQKTSKIKAPKTDDGFLFWLGIIALVMGVLSVTVIVEKNSVKRKLRRI